MKNEITNMRDQFPFRDSYEIPEKLSKEQLKALRDYLPPAEECRQMIREIQAALFYLAKIGSNDDNDGDMIDTICMIFLYHNMITGISSNELAYFPGVTEWHDLSISLPHFILPYL